ncbi:hypothetical protein D3C87_518740 [compost metagenome]
MPIELLQGNASFAVEQAGRLVQSPQVLAFMRQLASVLDDAYAKTLAPVVVAPTISPMTYTAASRMSLHVGGGTVSAVSFKRGTTTLTVGVNQLIPLNPGDQVVITYTVAPTITAVSR